MKTRIKEFIKSVTNGNGYVAKNQFDAIIRNKVREALETKKVEVAQDLYRSNNDQ